MDKVIVYYAHFNIHPSSAPPFIVELGTGVNSFFEIKECKHIPDSIEKIEAFCNEKDLELSDEFTLLYPIFLDAMDTDYESAMHQIAWLIKEQADKKGWNFDRISGYTGKTTVSFIPQP